MDSKKNPEVIKLRLPDFPLCGTTKTLVIKLNNNKQKRNENK